MPSLPLTQLDERGLAADIDNRTFSLTFAQPVPVKDLLLLLVRGTSLSVAPDPSIAGTFFGEFSKADDLEMTERFFHQRQGVWTLFLARFIPVVR